VQYTARIDLPAGPLGAAAWPVVKAAVSAGFRRSLRTLGRLVEQEFRTSSG
jgi:hypothetical protein